MNKFLTKKINYRFLWLAIPALLLLLAVYFWPQVIFAQTNQTVASQGVDTITNIMSKVVGAVAFGLVWVLGKVLIVLINLVIWVSTYNDFINAPAVSNGWTILRDICNMFFILILLVIAFATTLNQEAYGMKKLLGKFIIAAILINFSKLICGLIIDFAQVIMLTFVNGFRDIGGGNLADMLGITKLLSVSKTSCGGDISNWSIMGTFILAVIYVIVSTVVVTVILFVLVMRMVMIWIYVVLSPMAWLTSVLPATQKISNKWWTQFSEAVVSGPVLAFFIWLSFASATIGSSGQSIINTPPPSASTNEAGYINTVNEICAGASDAGSSDSMLKFVISIGLLIGGLIITKEIGGAAGSAAGKGLSTLEGMKKWAASPVVDRYKAFQSQRQKARQEKIQDFGAKAYGTYSQVTSGTKALAKQSVLGAKALPGMAIRGGTNLLNNKIDSKFTRGLVAGVEGYKTGIIEKRQRKADKKAARVQKKDDKINLRDRLQEAYTTGSYTDEKNENYNERFEFVNDKGQKSVGYRRVKKDKDNNEMTDENNNPIYEEALDKNGKRVEQLSSNKFNAISSWRNTMLDSRAFNNKRQNEEVSKKQQKMQDAGFTPGQLLAILKDSNQSQADRIASALTLAAKEAFKGAKVGDVATAQTLIKGTQNSGLMKNFNDTIDKKQAHLNYGLDKEYDPNNKDDMVALSMAMKKFAKRRADGKFDVLAADAYKHKNVIKALSDGMTKKEFVNHASRIAAYSSAHSKALEGGAKEYLKTQSPAFDADGNLDPVREVVAKVTGNLGDALIGHTDDKEMTSKIIREVLYSLSSNDVAKLKPESITKAPVGIPLLDYKKMLKDNLAATFTDNQLKSMAIYKDGNRKMMREIIKLFSDTSLSEKVIDFGKIPGNYEDDDNDNNGEKE